MGNSNSSTKTNSKYIARETFNPSEIAFNNFPLIRDGKMSNKEAHQLRIENPLRITIDDVLEMADTSLTLTGMDGTKLCKMKNITTGKIGLVIRDFVTQVEDDNETNENKTQSPLQLEP